MSILKQPIYLNVKELEVLDYCGCPKSANNVATEVATLHADPPPQYTENVDATHVDPPPFYPERVKSHREQFQVQQDKEKGFGAKVMSKFVEMKKGINIFIGQMLNVRSETVQVQKCIMISAFGQLRLLNKLLLSRHTFADALSYASDAFEMHENCVSIYSTY